MSDKREDLQTRTLTFEVDTTRAAGEGIPVVLSSNAVVEVSDGPEILMHTPDAIDLQRAPLPIIATHRSNQVNVGIIDNLHSDGNVLRGTAKFGTRDEAVGYRNDVVGGIIRSVSVGYARQKGHVRKDGVLITTRWMPTHTAMVAEPADVNAGFYRAKPGLELEEPPPEQSNSDAEAPQGAFLSPAETAPSAASTTEVVTPPPAAPAAIRSTAMSEVQTAAAGTADPKVYPSAVEIEKQRREAINRLCEASNVDVRVKEAWVERGLSLEQISEEFLNYMQERGKKEPVAASSLGLTGRETQRYSLFRAIRALHFGGRNPTFLSEAGFEIECSNQIAKQLGRETSSSILVPGEVLQRSVGKDAATRAMSTVPGSKGGYAVPIEQMGFIDILRNRSVSMRMGARVISGLQGNVAFPRQTGKVSVTWQAGEGTSVTAADQALGQLSMTPKTCIAITDVSEQLLRQMSPSAESFVMADLAADVAIDGVDAAAINGTGGAQPLGIKNTTGITSGQDAASATYAKVLAFVSTAGGSNAIRGNPGWLTNTAGAAKLMQVQRFTSTDTPVWEGNMLDGTLVGFNAMSSEQLASGNLIFGSFDELVIGEWGVLELSTDNGGTRFNQAQVGIRAMWMVDVMLRYPQAFVVSTNLS